MSSDPDPAGLLGRTAAVELLSDERGLLPEAVGDPPPLPPPSPVRRKLVATGATLTGVTLVGGIALIVFGAIDGISSGFGGLALVALILGIVMVSTHWGWVHVAEFTANSIESRRDAEVDQQRHAWLTTIEPYTRYEVSTHVEDDGALTIATVRHRPVPLGQDQFTFDREVLDPERHPDEAPAAVIAERAEQLRRQAALRTEQEHLRYRAAVEEHQAVILGDQDEAERLRARRAASEALANQINTNLRDPPLTE
jgi:hypothetical protein